MTRPTHGSLSFQIVIRPSGFESFIDTDGEICDGQIIHMFDRIKTPSIEVKVFHPPQYIRDELFTRISYAPVDIWHIRAEHTVKTMFGPIAIFFSAKATFVEPVRIFSKIWMVFVNMVDDKITQNSDTCIVCGIHKCMQFCFRAQTVVNFSSRDWPISMIGRNLMLSITG